jgi:hypothetical protein
VDSTLHASVCRRRLFDALAPAVAAAEAVLPPNRLRYVFMLQPPGLDVVLVPDEGQPARRFDAADVLPDRGQELAVAAEAVAAGILAALGERRAEAVLVNAATMPKGGLWLDLDPRACEVTLFLTEGDLGHSVRIGGLAEAPTVH